jgi:hypothetical protein
MDPVLRLEGIGALVLAPDGIGKDIVGLFRKGKKAQLGVVKETVDKMELQQHFLMQQLCPVKQDLMILKIVDILHLEGRHAYFPDDLTG